MNWILIALVVVAGLFILKFKEIRHRLGFFLAIALVLFLIIGAGQVVSHNSVDLTSFEGIVDAGKLYFSWLGQVAGNLGKVSSYVVKQDWDLNNITNG